jgi:hypothetical protein
VVNTMTWTAIRTDCGLPAAHSGSLLGARTAAPATRKRINSVARMVSFAGVPAYVADQESHPPRGCCPV